MNACVLVVGGGPSRRRSVEQACAAGGLQNAVVQCADLAEAQALLRIPSGSARARWELEAMTTTSSVGPTGPSTTLPLDPAVVVTDLRLGQGSGIGVLHLLRGGVVHRETPVVVVGDDATDAEIDEIHRHDATAYLAAVLIRGALLDVIRDLRLPWTLASARVGS